MKRISSRVAGLLTLFASCIAMAAPGDPDPTFGAGGVQLLDFGGPTAMDMAGVARQSTGKIVVVGKLRGSSTSPIMVGRLDADGNPDPAFGTEGWAPVVGTYSDYTPLAIAVAADDSIRVIGRTSTLTFVSRLNANGANDSFNTTILDSSSDSEAPRAATFHPNGSLLVAGSCEQPGGRRSCIVTYSGAGDRTGRIVYQLGQLADSANAILQAQIGPRTVFFIAGYADDRFGSRDFAVARLDDSLALDWSFPPRLIDFGGQDEATAMAIRSAGHLALAGQSAGSGGVSQIALASISMADGTPDALEFGIDGKVLTTYLYGGQPAGVGVASLMVSQGAVSPDGIYAAVTVRSPFGPPPGNGHVVVARYDQAGNLVAGFGSGGFADLPALTNGENDVALAAFDLPGRNALLALGARGSNGSLAGSRPDLATGALDTAYGQGGVLQAQPYLVTQDSLMTLAALPGGGYVGVMSGNGGVFQLFGVAPGGLLDPSFGNAGVIPVASSDYVVASQPDGKFLVAHSIRATPDLNSRFIAALDRYNGNGYPDFSFGNSGRALVDFGASSQSVYGIALQPDGKIVVAGAVGMQNPIRIRMAAARFTPGGQLDASFSGGGVVMGPNVVGDDEEARDVALQPDGKILVGGTGAGGWTVYRLLPSGAMDSTWAGGGHAVAGGCTPTISGMAVAPSGSVVVGGYASAPSGGNSCFAQLDSSGALDASFGSSGIVVMPLDSTGFSGVRGLAIDSAGRIVAGIGSWEGPALVRLLPGGALDPSFRGGAVGIPGMPNVNVHGVILQGDGNIVVHGTGDLFGDGDVLLARFEGGGAPPDTTPDPFAFIDVTGVGASVEVTSNAVTITGIVSPAAIAVSGGSYSIGCSAAFATAAGTIANGQTVCVRHVSSASPSGTTNTTLVVGGVSDTFTSVTAPLVDTLLTSTPPNPNGPNGNMFSFTSSNVASTLRFECALDGAAWTTCSSPTTLFPGDGSHTFQVRAVSESGADLTPASYTWFVDLVAPDTTITSAPPELTTSTTATFAFTSNDPTARFECSLDNASFTTCTSPKTYNITIDGGHLFQVRAVDPVGNADLFPAKVIWTVDSTPPDTTITSKPPLNSTSSSATFEFTTNDPAATLQCRVDVQPFSACVSPVTYTGLADGNHQFVVRAVDAAGNIDPSPAVWFWSIDTIPPDTAITSGPPALTASTSATFTMTVTGAATLACSLDGGAFATCASPITYTGLTDGNHTFAARAVDIAGNVDPTAATASWTVDTVAPDTLITSSPSALTSAQNATFTFISDETGASFQCALDANAFVACTSPTTYGALAEGLHTFRVKAIDSAGNADSTPAQHQWTIDTTAPDTLITSGPAPVTSLTSATFTFQSNEGNATFECAIDGAAYAACSSPASYAGLFPGPRVFRVRAIDAATNVDPTPSVFAWTIDRTGPDTTIDSSPPQATPQTSATFTFSASEAPVTFECRLDGAAFAACVSPVSYSGLADGSHTFDVRALDAVGNADPQPARWTWTVDTIPPDSTFAFTPIASPTNSTSFTATLATVLGGSYECRLDAGAWAPCSGSVTGSGLADGSHTFEARARDAAGNVDPTPATHTWVIDTAPPDTTILTGPSGGTTSTAANFTYSSTESPSMFFECRLDGAAFAACGPGAFYTNLPDGTHTFEVRAKDIAGNVDPTPASRTWTVDTAPPDTSIATGPSGSVASTSAAFAYAATEPATFRCQLDGSPYTDCPAGGITFAGLAQGSHTFNVFATDAVGLSDPTPASRTWIVDTIAPDTSITAGPTGNNNPDTATFTFASTEAGSTFQCSLDGAAFSACSSDIGYAGLAKGEHTFQVRAIDAAGNVDATPASRTWRVNK